MIYWFSSFFCFDDGGRTFSSQKKENKFRKIGFQCVFMVLCLVTYFLGLSSLFVPFFNFFVEHRLTSIFSLSFSLFLSPIAIKKFWDVKMNGFLGENRKGESKIIWKKFKNGHQRQKQSSDTLKSQFLLYFIIHFSK